MRTHAIEEKAKTILSELKIQSPPVPVEQVAEHLGLSLQAAHLGDNVSGILVLDGATGTIGYNSTHAQVRRRFSIAHELGHYILHKDSRSLFIDKRYFAVYHRNELSSTGEDRVEIEANRFAAALLMPTDMLKNEITKNDFDLGDEEVLSSLARKFNVSTQAMAYRLASLELFELPDSIS